MMFAVKTMKRDASPSEMCDLMRTCYQKAVLGAEVERGGTTFTSGLLQLRTMILATLQLGDSLVGASDTVTKKLCDAEVILYMDDAGCQVGPAHEFTITRAHSFTDSVEVERYRE